jgi:hypothetical protein
MAMTSALCKFNNIGVYSNLKNGGVVSQISIIKSCAKTLISVSSVLFCGNSFAWEIAKDFNVAPRFGQHEGTVEQSNTLFNFNPAGVSRRLRIKGPTFFDSLSVSEAGKTAEILIRKKLPIEDFKLPNERKPIYFAKKLFFLVAIKPTTLVIVPYEFDLKGLGPERLQMMQGQVQSNYHAIAAKERGVGLAYMSSSMDDWFNNIALSPVFNNVQRIEVISDLWAGPIALEQAVKDPSWPFSVAPSKRFSGYLEVSPRAQN